MIDDVTVIIRTVDERTLDVCHEILAEIFVKENIFLLRNVTPFSEAVSQTFQIGLKENKKWTLAVDADMLLSDMAIRRLLDVGDFLWKNDKKFFSLNGCLYDRFFMENRVLGPHLYNTFFLGKAQELVGDSYRDLRPETFIKDTMQKRGYNFYVCNICLGIHDFYQSYASIFRKGMLHAKKHDHLEKYRSEWERRKKEEPDFEWLCTGLQYGKASDRIIVDYTFFNDIIEKTDLKPESQGKISVKEVKTTIDEYVKINGKTSIYRPMCFENKVRRKIGLKEHKYIVLK